MSHLEDALLYQLKVSGLPEPQREYKFCPTRRWRADFCWPAARLLVEVEGGVWSQGRHTRGSGYQADLEKYNAAALAGWIVLRYSGEMITSGQAVAQIEQALRSAKMAEMEF